jgi:putative OPT family oligopeptide transporter
VNPATGAPFLLSEMSPDQIWSAYIRYIGAGAVLAAGLITLARTIPTIVRSAADSLKNLGDRSSGAGGLRTERELSMGVVLVGTLLLALFLAYAPRMPLQGNVLAAALIVLFGFFFSTVSARITGLIGSSSNPISGMTIATLILTCLLLVALGWTGDLYAPVALCVGAVVCIAAANAGNTSQDLKTGFLVGATPRYQQLGLIIGVVASAFVVGATTLYLHNVFGIGSADIAAPQATLMATIIRGLLSQNLPWGLVLVGVFIAVTLELCGIHSLSFAVGAYLPVATTAPIFAGGLVRWWVERGTGRREESEIGSGTLFSSGLIAGGSICGILYAVLVGTDSIGPLQAIGRALPWLHDESALAHLAGGLLFFALAVVTARAARKTLA